MAELIDYGFTNNDPSHTFFYVGPEVLKMLDRNKNTCILDLGCGNGHFVNHLVGLGYNAYGIDASANGIAIAKQSLPERFFIQDLSSKELPAGLQGINFDTIISIEVIEHLYDPEGFIHFCKQALSKGGEIIISTPYHGYLKNLVLSIFNKWDKHWAPARYGGHIKFWSRKTLTDLLTTKGFTFTRYRGCGRLPFFWKSMLIKAKID